MSDERRGPLLIGVLAVIAGAALYLAAGDVLSVPDRTFGAPRWVVAIFALGLFFGGGYALALALPTPRMRRLLGGAALLALVTGSAVFMTWLAFTGGGRRPRAPISADSLMFGPDVGAFIVRAFFWLFAIPLDAIALGAWLFALRALVRPPAP
jgi:hypothetical protein